MKVSHNSTLRQMFSSIGCINSKEMQYSSKEEKHYLKKKDIAVSKTIVISPT